MLTPDEIEGLASLARGKGAALGASGAAEIPASAPLVVSVDTSFDSSAWHDLLHLLDRFPANDKLYAQLRNRLAKQQVDLGLRECGGAKRQDLGAVHPIERQGRAVDVGRAEAGLGVRRIDAALREPEGSALLPVRGS